MKGEGRNETYDGHGGGDETAAVPLPAREAIGEFNAPHPSPLVLASASPRRRELLARLGVPFEVIASDVDETVPAGIDPAAAAGSLALLKARAVAAGRLGCLVIGADTIVALPASGDGPARILGKPRDDADAAAMLRALRGRWHTVSTGLAVVRDARLWGDVVTAEVRMRSYSDDEIERYVTSGEPRDKAGAYAVQGLGGALVAEVHGSELAVVGLPLQRLADLLVEAGVPLLIDPASIADVWAVTP